MITLITHIYVYIYIDSFKHNTDLFQSDGPIEIGDLVALRSLTDPAVDNPDNPDNPDSPDNNPDRSRHAGVVIKIKIDKKYIRDDPDNPDNPSSNPSSNPDNPSNPENGPGHERLGLLYKVNK